MKGKPSPPPPPSIVISTPLGPLGTILATPAPKKLRLFTPVPTTTVSFSTVTPEKPGTWLKSTL